MEKGLTLHSAWCKGCGICVAFCPKNVLELAGEKAGIARPEDCIACMTCTRLCPDYAIYFKEGEDNG